jgi:hypothetical protein
MLVYIIILFLVLITLYFSTKEGLSEVTAKPGVNITNNVPLPSNAAVYKTPIQMMDKINSILDGEVTKEDTLNGKLQSQNKKIADYSEKVELKSNNIRGDYSRIKDDEIPDVNSSIESKRLNIDDYNKIHIPYATELNKLCNENGPTNKFVIDQPTLKGIKDYITMLDNVYDKLKIVNKELINTYTTYINQPARNYSKVYASFMEIPNETLEPNIYV